MGLLDRLLGRTPPEPAPIRDLAGRRIGFAAQRIDVGVRADRRQLVKRQTEEKECWAAYRAVGEIGYVVDLFGNALRRVRIFPAGVDNPEEGRVPLEDCTWSTPALVAAATAELDRVRSIEHGQGEVLSQMAVNLKVAGAGNLFGRLDAESGQEDWEVLSTSSLAVKNGQWIVRRYPGDRDGVAVGAGDMMWRFWQRDPEWPGLAHSEMRRILGHASGLQILEQGFRARGRSRIAGNGALFMSSRVANVKVAAGQGKGDDFFDDLLAYMTAPMVEEGAVSSFAPLLVDLDVEDVSKAVQHVTFDRPLTDVEEKREDKLLRRIAQGLDAPPELITGMADLNHWCFDDETEVLTDRGWVGFDDIAPGDLALSLDHETGLSAWHPVSEVQSWQVDDLPMLSIEGRYHSSLTTLNHRWPVLRAHGRAKRRDREWTTSAELGSNDWLTRAAPCGDTPAEPKYTDALVELVGWFFTEGQCRYRSGRDAPQVAIYQSHTVNSENCARIRAALTALYGPPKDGVLGSGGRGGRPRVGSDAPAWREVTEGRRTRFVLNKAAAAPLVEHADNRIVASAFVRAMTSAQLELFITTAVRGDGSTMTGGTRWVGQADPVRLDAVELAAILAGYSVQRWSSEHDGFHRHVQHVVTFSRRTLFGPRAKHKRTVRYTGRIWCPVVLPTRTVLARRHGKPFFTGQTAWQVEESTYEAHVEPLALRIADIFAVAILRPALAEAGFPLEVVARVQVGVDPSDLVRRPNRDADVSEGHDRLVLSDETWRREKGYTDEDAPAMDELLRRMALKRGITTEMLTAELLANYAEADVTRTLAKGEAATAESEAKAGDAAAPASTDDGAGPGPPATGAGLVAASSSSRVGVRLHAIDVDLMARLEGAATGAVERALERAVSRATRAGRGKRLSVGAGRGLLARVDAATLGVGDEELVSDADFDQLAADWDRWVPAAWMSAAGVVDAKVEPPAEDFDAGWLVLLGVLVTATRAALHDGDGTGAVTDGTVTVGEADPAAVVQPGMVRAALARAGGAEGAVSEGGAVLLDAGTRPAGLIATGESILDAAAAAGLVLTGWTWRAGAPAQPFPPHQVLDGATFASWLDPQLANEAGSWPGRSHWQVGDHHGCRCTGQPNLEPAGAN